MSDNSTFSGRLVACQTPLVNSVCQDSNSQFGTSGPNLVTARALTAADVTPDGTPDIVTVTPIQ
jgi:hypothetical protein